MTAALLYCIQNLHPWLVEYILMCCKQAAISSRPLPTVRRHAFLSSEGHF
jgi:hypothetical protein